MSERAPCKACGVEGCTGRGPDGRALPGHAINSGGRVKKWLIPVRKELRAGSVEAAELLRRVIKDDGEKTTDRIAAAKTVLDFSVPKPKQTVEVKDATDNLLRGITADMLEKWAREDGEDGPSRPGSA